MANQNFRVKHGLEVSGNTSVSGITTLGSLDTGSGQITQLSGTNISISGIASLPTLDTTIGEINYLSGVHLDYSGIASVTKVEATNASIGVATVTTLDVTNGTIDILSGTNANISGVITATSFYGNLIGNVTGDLTGNADTSTNLSTPRDFSVSGDVATELAISFDGSDNVNLAVSLSNNFNANTSGIITAAQLSTGDEGSAIRVTSDTISGPSIINIDPSGIGDNTGLVVIKGDLQIDGTQTVVNSTAVTVDDKNIILGSGAENDAAADGGGITLESGDGNKTLNWIDSTDSWTSSENFDLASDKVYKIGGTEVLSSTLLTIANVNASGVITATTFEGNLTGNVDGIADKASELLTPRSFSVDGDVATASAVSFNGTGDVSLSVQLSNTFSADTTGIITATRFSSDQLNVTGLSTFADNLEILGSKTLSFNSSSLNISHDGTNARILNGLGDLIFGADGNGSIRLERVGVATLAKFQHGGSSQLYHNGFNKIETTEFGVTVYDRLEAPQLNVSGIATISQLEIGGFTPDGSDYGIVNYVPVADGAGSWSWQPIAAAGGGSLDGVTILEEGSSVGAAGSIISINFVGDNVTATATGTSATITLNDNPSFGNVNLSGIITASSFVKIGGTSSEFLKADGTVDSNTYLTSYTETNDLTSAVTWTDVPDENITQTSVTQHEGALSIGESQITFTSSFIELTDLSVGAEGTASGDGSISYDNTTGVFTYTPPDLSSYLTSYNETQTLDDVLTLGNTSSTGIQVGISTVDNHLSITSSDGSAGRLDLYCEVGNLHYTRLQAAAHGTYTGGNAIVTVPNTSGTLLLTDGDGSSLTGIVTSITAGTGISVDQSTGNVTITATGTGGIALTDLSVGAEGTASGDGSISYDNTTGVFTYTPPDLSSYLTSYTETQTLDDVLTLGSTSTTGIQVGVSTISNQLSITSNDGSVGRLDLYCEVSNLHYTRLQAAPHSTYSGNATVVVPNTSGTLLLTDGDGSSLTNIVTSITAGTGISVDQSTGNVTITATGGGGGIALTDLSVGAEGTASGDGAIAYDNTTGVFTYTPPDLSSYLTSYTVQASDLNSISIDAFSDVDTSSVSPTEGQALLWDETNSLWKPGTISSGGISLSDLSVTTATASGGGSLSYDNTTGEFTFTPAESGGGGSSTFLGLTDTPGTFTASKYLAVNSAGDAIEYVDAPAGGGGGISVGTRTGTTDNDDLVTGVTEIRFAKTPFTVTDLSGGKVFVLTESSFNPIQVNGSDGVTASGEETLNLIAGDGITITANNNTSPKSLTFTASGGGGGGATSLGDLSDVDLTTVAPVAGRVLKYNGTAWTPAVDNTGDGGGGGGGGDGTAFLGENSRLTYDGGLVTLTTTTQINDAIDGLNLIMTKLAPPTPPPLSSKTLSLSTKYTAKVSGTNETNSNVTDVTKPVTANVTNFYDGDNGTLSFEVNGVVDGSIVLSAADDTGTNAGLTIISDTDPYINQPSADDFWKQLTAKGQSTTDLAVGSEHTYQLKHTTTGSTNLLSFFVDNPGTSTVSGITVDQTEAEGAITYVSGVPTFAAGTNVYVSATVEGAVGKCYNSSKVADISGTQVNLVNIAPDAAGYNEGDSISITNEPVTFKSGVFLDGDLTLTLKGYNSKGTSGTPATTTVAGRIDTKSNESNRKTSGSGQYPTSGYGDPYDSTQSLLANEELQLLNNEYVYPSTDYSSNALAGPNYSTASGIRYVTFEVAGPTAKGSATLNITATGLSSKSAQQAFVSIDNIGDIVIQMKFENTGPWHNCNAAWSPSGDKTLDGFTAINASPTINYNPKYLNLGDFYTSSKAWVRIGLAAGSTAKITGVSVTYQ